MNRAYATLEIKAAQDGRRLFSGVASSISVDREGDIVVPAGAQFKLPLPLLMMHDSTQPVGWVQRAVVSADSITIDGEIADIAEPGPLKDRLTEAWQLLTSKLVRGLSIGFKSIESARIENTFSQRFISWLWLELSCVTIPANADASITSIKSFDQQLRAASGQARLLATRAAAAAILPPGASGKPTHVKLIPR